MDYHMFWMSAVVDFSGILTNWAVTVLTFVRLCCVFRTHSVVMCRYVCGSVKYELISLHLVCLDDGFETYSNGILIHGSARRFLYVSLQSMSLMAQSYLSLTSSPSIRGIGDTWPHLFLNILGPSCFLYGRHPAAAPINNSWILSVYGKYLLQICLRMHLDILFVD